MNETRSGLRLLLVTPSPPPAAAGAGPHPYPMPVTLGCTDRVDIVYCEGAPPQVWNAAGARRVAPLVEEQARRAESEGYDAVVINCMLDPALAGLQDTLSIPVVGAGAASFACAGLVGQRPALIYPGSIPVYELHDDPAATMDGLLRAARSEIDRGADVLIPACTELDGLAEDLRDSLGVPVLPCLRLALQSAETLAAHRLRRAPATGAYARWTWLWRVGSRRLVRALAMLRR